ncbi:beta strand repeat-containing protein, partial [Amylibacter marinus]|uniref:beta strand repeat-containing protein n=1 Tax=Amylibacter marinus TaxID=1475483 RepID=UPI003D6853AB
GVITGAVTNTNGTFTNRGDIQGDVDVANGLLNNNLTITGEVDNSGTFNNNAAGVITGAVTNTTGTFTNSGDIQGDVDVTAGTFTNNLTITGEVDNSGTFNNNAAGVITGAVTNTTGTFTNSGDIQGDVDVTAGTFTNNLTITGEVDNSGTFNNNAAGVITGAVTNSNGTFTNRGDIQGDVDVTAGTFTNNLTITGAVENNSILNNGSAGVITGNVTNTAGTMTNDGDIQGDVAVDGGTFDFNGTMTGNLTNDSTTSATGTITGMVTNNSTFTADGALTGITSFINAGTMNVTSGTTTVGTFSQTAGSTSVDSGATLAFTTGTVSAGSTLSNSGAVSGPLTNNGVLTATGTAGDFTGAVVLASGSSIDLRGSAGGTNGVGDALTFSGGTSGSADVYLDVDLATGAGGLTQSDYIDLGGSSTADLAFTVNDVSSSYGLQDDAIVLATDIGSMTYTLTGLPVGGSVLYSEEIQGSDLVIVNNANPAIGGISGGLSLVQSLLGTVINRPSSANVSAVAFDDEDGCNTGIWTRATGGVAESTSTTRVGSGSTDTTLDAKYGGFQAGADWGCSDSRFGGWNMAFGGVGGINVGTTSQDVFAGDVLTSVIDNDFNQSYAGVYLSATKNGYIVDFQVRAEKTKYEMSETAVGGALIGLNGVEFDSSATTVSGAVSRAIYSEQLDMTLVPVGGFGYSQTSTDDINFANGELLETPDRTTVIGFAGISAVKSKVADTGDAATNYFGTFTVYNDFSDPTKATFTDASSNSQDLETDTIGLFGELSLGVAYVKLFDEGAGLGKARQMNLSARIDARANADVKSYGLTLNARLTF